MTQADLFAFARASDPYTSHEAAAEVPVTRLEAIVLEAIRASAIGRTIDELVDATGLDKVSISPRLRPLCNKGCIVESTHTRPGRSGKQQIVWHAK
jgi:predicted transcriptional regulator